MSPIPINASMGMLISLAVSFIITPWLSRLWLSHAPHDSALTQHIAPLFKRLFPFFAR